MTGNKKDIRERLQYAESVLEALRKQEVDAVVGKKGVALLRLREIEESLRQSEARYRSVVENSHDGIHELDLRSGRYVFMSPAQERLTGFSLDELVGMSVDDAARRLHPDDREQVNSYLARVIDGEEPEVPMEYRWRVKSGEYRWFSDSRKLIRDENGEGVALVGISRDITRRKHAEEALRESEKSLRLAQAAGGIGIYNLDLLNREATCSEEYYEVMGRPSRSGRKVRQEEWLSWIHPEDRPRIMDEINGAIDKGTSHVTVEYRVIDQEESVRWVYFRGQIIRDSRSNPVSMIGAVQDISFRKQAEKRLLQQHELLQRIVDNIPVLLVMWDPEMQRFTLNRIAEEVLGCTTVEANAGDFMARIYPDPAYRQQVSEYMRMLDAGWREWTITNYNGEKIPIDWANVRLTDNTRIGIGVDLRQRKHEEKERERLLNELKSVNRELEGFTYSVSHDIKAPIHHLVSFTDLMRKKCWNQLDDRGQKYLDVISTSSRKLNNLVNELLEYSRMGRAPMKKSEVDLKQLIREVMENFSDQLGARDIRWNISDLPVVHGDAGMLYLVFLNLLSNALKFTTIREVACIDIFHEEEDEYIISVKDNGAGFDMQYYDKLFNVFQRLHSESEFDGSGLGLANVARIIQRHGGRVWAASEIDKGASFHFSLPK
jgi:PAS domain S-box-containing protein